MQTSQVAAPLERECFPAGQSVHFTAPSLAFANLPAGHSRHSFKLASKYLPGSWHSNVGALVGSTDGNGDGSRVGSRDGDNVGPKVGTADGNNDGKKVGVSEGLSVGCDVGIEDGDAVGTGVG